MLIGQGDSLNRAKVDGCVESLCNHGCARVTLYIQRLRAGEIFVEVENLDDSERCLVLRELESIMAPYDISKTPG